MNALLDSLTKLINKVIRSKSFPIEWKTAIVTPIFKKGNRTDQGNYRPVSILPIVSKIAEKAVALQLKQHLEDYSLINRSQHGFRTGHSTATCLLEMTENIYKGIDEGKMTGVASLDLSKAFDTIDHNILLVKLVKYIGKGQALELISDYIKNRRQIVKIGNCTSSVKELLYGVPQGSVLGPILFLLYINDITSVVEHCRTTMYADDTSIYYTSYHASNVQNDLNKDLSKLRDWFDLNKLKLNISKCSFTIMKSGRNRRPANVNVFIGGKTITQENEIKILGVTLDKNLTFTTHIKNLKKNLKYC